MCKQCDECRECGIAFSDEVKRYSFDGKYYCSQACEELHLGKKPRHSSGKTCRHCDVVRPAGTTIFCSSRCRDVDQEIRRAERETKAVPWRSVTSALMRAKGKHDTSLIPELERVLRDYLE